MISIHALREEGDQSTGILRFNARGNFYPRPPRGGRPEGVSLTGVLDGISIHALREEGDGTGCGRGGRRRISIHALREEGDS